MLRTIGARRVVERAALAGPVVEVAPGLLGALLVRVEDDRSETIVRVVEVEAYRQDDPASHSYRGRTARTEPMFGPPGTSYVYFTYGMHHCVNVSCEPEGVGAAVLLRAGIVLTGFRQVSQRRPGVNGGDVARGPARLAAALGLDRSWSGIDLLDPAGPLRLEQDGFTVTSVRTGSGPRVGIRAAADRPWRWWLSDVPEVSTYRRHPRS